MQQSRLFGCAPEADKTGPAAILLTVFASLLRIRPVMRPAHVHVHSGGVLSPRHARSRFCGHRSNPCRRARRGGGRPELQTASSLACPSAGLWVLKSFGYFALGQWPEADLASRQVGLQLEWVGGETRRRDRADVTLLTAALPSLAPARTRAPPNERRLVEFHRAAVNETTRKRVSRPRQLEPQHLVVGP